MRAFINDYHYCISNTSTKPIPEVLMGATSTVYIPEGKFKINAESVACGGFKFLFCNSVASAPDCQSSFSATR